MLEALPGAAVNVELKAAAARDLRLAAGRGRGRPARRRPRSGSLVSSFDFRLLAAFRAAAPEVARGLLFEGGHPWRCGSPWPPACCAAAALHPDARALHPGPRPALAGARTLP